jgi:polysaccharide pyruvyl transferase WcaK-like protein/SAM-dependent methyltransferase
MRRRSRASERVPGNEVAWAANMNILITNSVPLNGGDEALLQATVESLRVRWPQSRITVLCRDVDQARARFTDLSIESDLEFVKSPSQRACVSNLYREADLVLSAPGGFLNDHYPLAQRLRGFEVAIALGKPVVLFAQSIGPFWKKESVERIGAVLNRISLILVRDAASQHHLIDCGVARDKIRETADAAFLWRRLAPELFRAKEGPVRSVALSFRSWPLGDPVEVQKTLSKAEQLCRHLLAHPNRSLVFLSTCQGVAGYVDDSLLAVQIVERLPQALRDRCRVDQTRYAPRELMRLYGECDAFMGMRLHGCVLSMLAGTPAMGLGYEEKTQEVYHQLGLDPYQIPFTADLDDWLSGADRLLADIDTIRASLGASLDRLATRAARSLDYVEESLAGRHLANGQPPSPWTHLTEHYDVPHLRLRQVAELVRQIQPCSMVDLGCATGHLRSLCPAIEYVGCDFVRPAGAVAFPFYQCDFNREEIPADLQELEMIVCSGLLEYIEDLPGFLSQLRSRLRPQGNLVVTYFNMNHISRVWVLLRGKSFPIRADWRGLYSPRDVADLMAAAGFTIEQTFAMNHALGSALDVNETVVDSLTLPRVRPWSRFLSHQFLYVAKAAPFDDAPLALINDLMPEGAKCILVDDAQWPKCALGSRQAIPFVEKDGQYHGPPADDAEAIREFDRLHQLGAEFIVFGPPAFWWFDYYTEFARYLKARFPCISNSDRLRAFDLRAPSDPLSKAD